MARKVIGSQWDRENRNAINENFIELYRSKHTADEAKTKSEEALKTANQAKQIADSTKNSLDKIIKEQTEGGNIVPEVVDARGGETTLGKRLDNITISIKDTYRQAVEAATGGKNTVMYDDKGNPSIMVCIPRFNLSDVIDGAPDVPHPAFIVNGVVKNEIWISKYQNIVHDDRAYSLPGMDPHVDMNFDQAKQYCENKGPGWHLMTNAEWAAIALWCKKNVTMPRGNNNHGKDHSAPHERGRVTYTYTSDGKEYIGRVATGSGPVSWSHDGTNAGIFDLNGNVTEWVDGIRVENGKIYVHKDNDFSTPTDDLGQWVDTGAYFDNIGGLVLNSERTKTSGTPSRKFKEIKAADGYTIPDLLKYLAVAPIDSDYGGDNVYVNLEGSRFVRRGGSWGYVSTAGVFCLDATYVRSGLAHSIGFRAAWVSPTEK